MIGALLALGTALAGDVYINGVRAPTTPVMTMEGVTVRFDAQGNVWIDAPQYQVTVVKGGTAPPPAAASPAYTPPPTNTPPAATYTPPAPAYPAAAPAPAYTPPAPAYTPPPAAKAGGVSQGVWWLVTEDNDSVGQDVEVTVNGVSVRHVRSADPQAILDLGPFLHSGSNTIQMQPAPGSYDGGALVIYVGKGATTGGTVRLDNPEIRYTRRAVDLASGGGKSFALIVP